ncbi:protein YgfX [Aliagarivorans taiwanensis]|uniref:protein YgfX n=1 Tax=Aliagarivorans taiwanensis TaxID=561966 RepID=UPI0012FACB76|nr:protein YgfX [Aliagarivorans taiwanensis]
MSSSSALKHKLQARRSLSYLALVFLSTLVMLAVIRQHWQLLSVSTLPLINLVFGLLHWWRYRPRFSFSAEQLWLADSGDQAPWQWSQRSRVGLGFCLVVAQRQGERRYWLVFADSAEDSDYRRLCAVINLLA